MLEECDLPYEAHKVDIQAGEQMTPEFLSLNPNNNIPVIINPQGANGQAGQGQWACLNAGQF